MRITTMIEYDEMKKRNQILWGMVPNPSFVLIYNLSSISLFMSYMFNNWLKFLVFTDHCGFLKTKTRKKNTAVCTFERFWNDAK